MTHPKSPRFACGFGSANVRTRERDNGFEPRKNPDGGISVNANDPAFKRAENACTPIGDELDGIIAHLIEKSTSK
ncbi:hypothetical protein [Streptomyces sp. NPDC102264]|uniref:hypothetical protein n=1 Tax=Streptomyces sp. NPDC102264 TaxID=3366149 RepID=UPI0037F43B0F